MKIALILAAAGLAGSAQAGFYIEEEPNNSLATANFVGAYTFPGDGFVVDGAISNADQDWFKFTVTAASQLIATMRGLPNSGSGRDGYLELFDGSGNLLAFDDDSGINFMPALEYDLAGAGTYFLRVTNFPQTPDFDYKLSVGLNVAPTPGSAAMLAIGGLALVRRRR